MSQQEDFSDRIAAYNEELRRYYRRAHGYSSPPQGEPSVSEDPMEREPFRPEPIVPKDNPPAVSENEQPLPVNYVDHPGDEAVPPEPTKGMQTPESAEDSEPLRERPWESVPMPNFMPAPQPNGIPGFMPVPEPNGMPGFMPAPQQNGMPNFMPIPQPNGMPGFMPVPEPNGMPNPRSKVLPMVPPSLSDNVPPFGVEAPQEPGESPRVGTARPSSEQTDIGYLRVRTSSARGAIPLAGATVTIRRNTDQGEQILHITETDMSGFTPTFSLPTLRRSLSLQPGNPFPTTSYIVQADYDGYYSSINERVPVYGGVTSVQEISMIPLPEAGGQEEPIFNAGQTESELN